MKPTVKKGIIITSVIAVAVGGIVGVKFYLDSNKTVEVNSVSSLNTGYWSSPYSSTGFISNSDTQSIYYDTTKTITNVFVSEGQTVNAGDRLLQYDLTSLQSTVELDQLAIDKANNDLTLANYELKKLTNTTPAPSPTPTPIPTPMPDPSPVPIEGIPEKDENGNYPYIVDISQAETNITGYTLWVYHQDISPTPTSEAVTQEENEGETPSKPLNGPDTDENWKQFSDDDQISNYSWYWISYTYTDSHTNPYDENDVIQIKDDTTDPREGIHLVGTKKNPYKFYLVDGDAGEAYVYGKLFTDHSSETIYFQFNLYDEEENDYVPTWLVRADKFAMYVNNEGDKYYISSHTEKDRELIYPEEDDSDSESVDDIDYSGYTASELAVMIRDKKLEIKKLDLNLRKAQLQLKEDQALLNDGTVYAIRGGVVKKVSEIDNPPQDGSAFLEVAGGNGYYIEGTISELVLDTIKKGDSISCYSWTSGNTYTATIETIDDYPSSSGYYNGTGNPNTTYYGFVAYVDDEEASLTLGDYLEITFDGSTQEDLNNEIWLSGAYVRKDGKQYYVYKEDNGVLVKQYVTVGNIVYSTYQIKDGLNDSDFIAFAYGKNAKEGMKVKNTDDSMEESYD